jgi:hypothetical protein
MAHNETTPVTKETIMTIVITLPSPAMKQRANAVKTNINDRVEHVRYERMIKKSQKKIGPYVR